MKRNYMVIPPIAAILAAMVGQLATPVCAEPRPSPAPSIGIGGGEGPQTHLLFDKSIPKGAKIVKVSTHLIVDKASPSGLNFFAIQVNFPNKTWAHGGPQLVQKRGKPFQQANWGGLVNRGGGSKDYKEVDWAKDLLLIECGIGKPNTVPWEWELNREYVLTVERGKQVHLPAGESHNVRVPERTMWVWKFTIEPVDKAKGGKAFTSLIYDSADSLRNFYLWNESGYGSTSTEQHSRWSLPVYRIERGSKDAMAADWKRF
jgi:hypothetical protein